MYHTIPRSCELGDKQMPKRSPLLSMDTLTLKFSLDNTLRFGLISLAKYGFEMSNPQMAHL